METTLFSGLIIGCTVTLLKILRQQSLHDQEDHHIWRLDASGCYSSKSAYKAYFPGAVTFEPWRRLWKT